MRLPEPMTSEPLIQLTVNGRPVATRDQILIPDFLREQDLNPDRVVVERNGRAMTRSESASVPLCNGDVLEVVRIVAGG